MKPLNRFERYLVISILGGILLGPLLSSCGSDITTAGIGGTGITQGEITAFGSIFVNGVEFNTDSSTFEVDGNAGATQANLAIGMVVKVRGEVDSNGLTGTADSVEYDDEIQGPVAVADPPTNGQRTLTVFDKIVTIDESTTRFEDTSFSGIKRNDIIEISGYYTSSTDIRATFVKYIGAYSTDTEVEIKGTIDNLSVSNKTFYLSGVAISYDDSTEIDVPGGTLSNDLYVEVEGDLQSLTTVLAKEIELEDEDFEDGDEVNLQGVISAYYGDDDFIVSGQSIDASDASFSPSNVTLENGVNIEVEGEIINGVLIADEVELREGEVEIKTFVSGVPDLANNQFELGFTGLSDTIQITVNNQTSFEDETSSDSDFNLSDIDGGDFIEVEGLDSGSQITATQVKRIDSSAEDTEVQGIVEKYTAGSITLFGITFVINSSLPSLYPMAGDLVKITDHTADGIFDEIEFED